MNFLQQMAAASRERVQRARAGQGEAALLAACRSAAQPPLLELAGFDVIAEIKRHSPAEGALGATVEVAGRAAAYAGGGAAAVSVLTEPARFGGSLEDLAEAAAALQPAGAPAMRKDFLVDPWQLLEARAAGAGGALLIVAMLDDVVLGEMLATAAEHGLFVLLEAFDEVDLERAGRHAAGRPGPAPVLVGVNTRDLRTLAVDATRLERLAPWLPPGMPAVAESGLHTAEDAARAAGLGYRLALVGTALMRASDPGGLVARMVDAGRRLSLEPAQ